MLADALALADEEQPGLLADFATLTGAARVALGPDLPAFFTDDEALAPDLARCARAENDPLWRLPLWPPYESMLEFEGRQYQQCRRRRPRPAPSRLRLFLQPFRRPQNPGCISTSSPGTPTAKPARPEGAECQAARALYQC